LFSVKAQIFYNIFGIHRDPHYWKQPDLFVPELHFNTEEGQRQHQYAFLPWSVGERKCIGMNLAYFHTKLTLLMIYKLFVLRYHDPQQAVMHINKNIFLIPKENPKFRIVKRNKP
jgi:cytochrome P450